MRNRISPEETLATFLNLTEYTVPSGQEKVFADNILLPHLKELGIDEPRIDSIGNIFVDIGESSTMFTAHTDDVSRIRSKVNHLIDADYRMLSTDGSTILGADNKAGVYILLELIRHRVPGQYAFFISEEIGCVGSRAVAPLYEGSLARVISFDRKAYGSVITHQSYGRTCSDSFADDLIQELAKHGHYGWADDGGVYTDSNEFAPYVSECTNLSVGMYNCHSTSEKIDIKYLNSLANALIHVNWEQLGTYRSTQDSRRRNRYDDYGGWQGSWEHNGKYWDYTTNYKDDIDDDYLASKLGVATTGSTFVDDIEEVETRKCVCCEKEFYEESPYVATSLADETVWDWLWADGYCPSCKAKFDICAKCNCVIDTAEIRVIWDYDNDDSMDLYCEECGLEGLQNGLYAVAYQDDLLVPKQAGVV